MCASENISSVKDDFIGYLEEHDVINHLSRVLLKLFEEKEKPSDAIKFIREHLNNAGSGHNNTMHFLPWLKCCSTAKHIYIYTPAIIHDTIAALAISSFRSFDMKMFSFFIDVSLDDLKRENLFLRQENQRLTIKFEELNDALKKLTAKGT
ncbi:C-Myc-binding protein, putative (MYCBP) [Plasmodium ovale curtisi]|uniref:c-Myc-binding protein, putative (MYCBP) n=1 Tax=Plasmodium ovale curtisi TaxID=864141 RepID=A0A1A8WYU1_PLAOA|nr:C-Myc-binding protein, putative (MYCBP) [Plasmodium ovale curtisi]SBS98139.1 C-Myc-binding protein, putative (MYCBP) [Plasmodium ovale curtisi]